MNSPSTFFNSGRIDVAGLTCIRGFHTLFEDLDFSVESGTALHVVGANGSGKTSLLRIVCGLSLAESGQVLWNGAPIKASAGEFQSNLSYLGHKPALKADLNPLENLESLGAMRDQGFHDPKATALEFLARLEVAHTKSLPCRQLSAGQKQRIALARVVMSGAQIWCLDEPGTSLDSSGVLLLTELMQHHIEQQGIIIFTSHQDFGLPPERLRRVTLGGQRL